MGRKHILLVAAAIVAAGFLALQIREQSDVHIGSTATGATQQGKGAPLVDVTLPAQLSANAEIGKRGFEEKCATCHGVNAAGKDGAGPPLVHKVYEPSHHADESFQLAVVRGVKSHHWGFGDMAPVDGLTRGDVKMIVAYIRELQGANGIN